MTDIYRFVLGASIAQIREHARLKQTDLAQKAGVTQATVSRIEHGILVPDMTTVRAMALGLGLKPQTLLATAEAAQARAESLLKDVSKPVSDVGLGGLASFAVAVTISQAC